MATLCGYHLTNLKAMIIKKRGHIFLLTVNGEFVTSVKYTSAFHRRQIIEKWERQYALHRRKYILIIKPDSNEPKP